MPVIPICMAVDIEPDPRQIDRRNPPRWHGFESFLPWWNELRDDIGAGTNAIPSTWLLRMDSQIRIAYGDGTWAAHTYRREFDGLLERGDEVGLHTHFYRWDDGRDSWVVEHADPAWAESCIREALASYRDAFRTNCRVQSQGDRMLTERMLAVYEEEGLAYDFTVEPGLHELETLFPGELHTGSIPNFVGLPRDPWRPSRTDIRQSDPSNGYRPIIFPTTTFPFPPALEIGRKIHQLSRRLRGRLVSEDHRQQDWARCCVSYRPWFFEIALARALSASPIRAIHMVLRSDLPLEPDLQRNAERNLRRLAADPRFEFMLPDQAIAMAVPELAGVSG
jgi:hypothetical protein